MEPKLTITRRTIAIASISVILITVLVLAFVSFALSDNRNNHNNDSDVSDSISHESSDVTIVPIDDSSDEVSDESDDVSSVFAQSDDGSTDSNDDELFHGWIINEYGYTYVYDGCGYEQFNYKSSAMDRYIDSFDDLVDILPEKTRIFNIIVPVSSTFASIPREIYTSDNFYNQSQSAFSTTVASKNNARIIDIPIVNLLEAQYDAGEYVYFKTDKNWTSLGAYNAYRVFCEMAQIDSYPLVNYPKKNHGDFLGSFYNATQLSEMYESPDTFISYSTLPSVKTSLTVYDGGMIYSDYKLCDNNINLYNGYNVYLGRSASRYEINTTSKGGSLLIIGDTSAHPIIPFFATHYSKIDVIDPRKFNEDLCEFLSVREYDDCITMCYSTNAVSGEYIPAFNNIIGDSNG